MDASSFVGNVDVFPFSQIIWNSVDDKNKWEPILNKARKVHDMLEYEMVRHGIRKCATLHLSPKTFDKQIEQLQADHMVWIPLQRTKNYGGFSHKHYSVNELDLNCSVYGVLARNMEDAEAFKIASTSGSADHKKIGELLGFPQCCSEAFVNWWPTYFDPVYQAAQTTSGAKIEHGENYDVLTVTPHIATQQMLRYVGLRLTSHFPCSLECEATKRIGKLWLDLGMEVDRQGTEALLKILSLPGEWSCCHGVAVVELEPFTIVTNSLPTKRKWAVRWKEVIKE